MSNKKSQLFSETFKYILAGFLSIAVLIAGYKSISAIQQRSCTAEIKNFESELRDLDKNLRYGTKELKSYVVPCGAKNIYFFDFKEKIDLEQFNKVPVMKNSLKASRNPNLFLVRESKVIDSFYIGNLEIQSPYYLCLLATSEKMAFFAEGTSNAVKITLPEWQLQCS